MARALALVAAAAVAALAAGAAPGRAGAACARYASSHGSDRAAGTAAHPFRSAQRLVSSLAAGTTGCLDGGSVFTERVVVNRRVTLRGLGRLPTIVGGVTFTPAAAGASLRHVAVRGHGAGRAAVVVRADRVVVSGDTITGRGWVNRDTACVLLAGTRGAVVDGNRISTCTRATRRGLAASGVFVGSAYGARVSGNLVVHTGGYGIVLGPNAQHSRVVHNLVDGNSISVLITGNGHTASSYDVVESNILSNAGINNVRASWGGAAGKKDAVVANCVWQGFRGNYAAPGVRLAGNVVTSPRYVNRPSNYSVRAPSCVAKRPAFVAARVPTLPLFRVTYHVRATATRVQIVRLGLAGLVAGSRLTATCTSRCSGRWTGVARGSTTTMSLLAGRWVPVGATVDVRATMPGRAGAYARVRVSGLPNGLSISHACLRPGHTVAVSCRSVS